MPCSLDLVGADRFHQARRKLVTKAGAGGDQGLEVVDILADEGVLQDADHRCLANGNVGNPSGFGECLSSTATLILRKRSCMEPRLPVNQIV